MDIIHKLEMDLEIKAPTPWLELPQGDVNTRKIRFLLTANQMPWAVPENASVLICFRKSDGTVGEYDTLPDGTLAWEATNNLLTVSLAPQVLTSAGTVMLYASIRKNEKNLHTFGVEIRVRPSANDNVENRIDRSEDYFYITRVVPGPDSAQVGQYLCVEEVDAHGRVTRVKAVDLIPPLPGNIDVPKYWQLALDAGVKMINAAMLDAGHHKSAFLFYTDAHWNYNSQKSPNLLKYLYQHTGMNKTFFGGDIVLNESANEDAMAYLWQWREQLKGLPNHHSVVGNHDDGNTTNNLFSEEYVYGYLLAAEETPDIVRGDNGLYYYIDSPTEKTRYLCLDTAFQTALYDAVQLKFIVDALKSVPEHWHIVAVAHMWYDTDYAADPPVVGGLSYAGQKVLRLFDAYNARQAGTMYVQASSTDTTTTTVAYDFTGCGGKVEFCIGGHTHWDYDGASDGGIPVILCETDSTLVRSGLDAALGTADESAVSGIIADYDAGKITVVRVGRGVSRVVNGEQDEPGDSEEPETPVAYTNQLKISTDRNGNVYNGIGYRENTRSNSSGMDQEAPGWDVTGFIPAVRGDIIRFKNVTFMDLYGETTGTNRCAVHFFDSEKTLIVASAAFAVGTAPEAIWNVVYAENGDIIQFTLPSNYSSSIAYIRIIAHDYNENSVITVNEEITQ